MSPDPPPGSGPACPNCGAPVPDRYCTRCGQRYADRLPSVRRMAVEFFDDQFSLNGALPRTLALLFLRPGSLTREYVAGRIVRRFVFALHLHSFAFLLLTPAVLIREGWLLAAAVMRA